MIDGSHLSCFKEQANIILLLLKIIEKDEIDEPIFDPENKTPHNMHTNKDFIK